MPAPLNPKLEYTTRQRFHRVRSVAGEGGGFVLDAGGQLTPGDAPGLAAPFERVHLLSLHEPVGFGRFAAASGIFHDLLRADKNREERISHGF